ncbi:serine hydrolase domain-containing protein [Streptococcus oricebi]|uniref:Methicillin resistance protein FmtA n=1 Tax=Streptococcus oricebi TaxID=1547447 RepID=A0ABS5B2L5_9STRE|nr:serine hydrolase domain-containing protein [Streptococcus oricebi]MBP2623070.1 methicillin resistance protein FmtA [Streptococcus oricebi]
MKQSFLKASLALVTCGLLAFGAGHARADEQKLPSGLAYDQIGQKIEDYYHKNEKTSAGLAAAVIDKDGKTLYQQNFGYMDKEKKLAVDDDSVFEWGSTTKTTVWVSVMQLWEEGKIDLKADIRTYLPKNFLKNLKYSKPLTMLDLMNHQEGFDETTLYLGHDKSLEELLKKDQPPQTYQPGQVTAYSNYGTALAAYIVERVSGQSYADYVHEHIFQPLGMKNTALKPDLSDNAFVQEKRKSEKTYDSKGQLMGSSFFEVGLYPAGRAVGKMSDLKLYAQALLEKKLLFKKAETWETFYSASYKYPEADIPINAHGLWSTEYENTRTLGHGGNTTGFTTSLLLDLKSGIASVIMVNQGHETTFTSDMTELIYGKKKSASKEAVKNFQAGFYRITRTFNQGPLSLMKMVPMTSHTLYITDPSHSVAHQGFWTAGEKDGRYVISLPISDYVKMSTFDVIKDYAFVIFAGLALAYVLLAYLGAILIKCYRLIFRKQEQNPAPLAWKLWHYLTGALILLLPVNFMTAISTIQATASTASSRWQFMIFALVGLALIASGLLPFVWPSLFKQASKARNFLTIATSSAAFIMLANILYWSLYQWWLL